MLGGPLEHSKNNIGVLRLLLASLVIVSHSPEMVDGNRSHEILNSIFHTMSLGDLCVDGFFLLSGYLITQSMEKTASLPTYLAHRILRIYPGFIACFLLCVFVLAPALRAEIGGQLRQTFLTLVLLGTPPVYAGQMPGLAEPNQLNWSMWTIAYEFRCYLMVALLWAIGIMSRRAVVLGLTILAVGAHVASTYPEVADRMQWPFPLPYRWQILGGIPENIRLMSHFLIGTSAYLYRDDLEKNLTAPIAALLTVAMLGCMFHPHLADTAVGLLGGFPLFWLALKADLGRFQRINDRWDISYGVYLYGWPIGITLRWIYPGLDAWLLVSATLPLALLCGVLSWHWVEKPVKGLRKKIDRKSVRSDADLAHSASGL